MNLDCHKVLNLPYRQIPGEVIDPNYQGVINIAGVLDALKGLAALSTAEVPAPSPCDGASIASGSTSLQGKSPELHYLTLWQLREMVRGAFPEYFNFFWSGG